MIKRQQKEKMGERRGEKETGEGKGGETETETEKKERRNIDTWDTVIFFTSLRPWASAACTSAALGGH